MATTTLTITLDNSIVTLAQQALCWQAGTSVSAQNAKQQLITLINNAIVSYQNVQIIQSANSQPPAAGLIT